MDDLEIEEALRKGREEKYYRLKQEEYRQKIKQQSVYKTYSADNLFNFYSMQYNVDKDNEEVVKSICKYFSGDESFDGDLDKGLILMGGVGVGKTSLMKFFIRNQRFSYKIESCRDVETNYAQLGDNYTDRCSFNIPVAINSDPFGHQVIGFCFDDLGTEANGKHYGKEKNVMAEILLNRYDNNLPYLSTHVTTNLTVDEIKTQYGSRVGDRMRQMFNQIQFPIKAKSRR